MTRLIDADSFENYVFDEWKNNEISNGDWMTFREWLRDQETVDAVPVIRCKDCKHRYIKNDVWTCPFGLPSGPDGYCSYAERKES